MQHGKGLFLNLEQTLEAIRFDFRQYGVQAMLFGEIMRLIAGEQVSWTRPSGSQGVWVRTSGQRNPRWLEADDLVEYMCTAVSQARRDPDLLTAVAARVFQTRAYRASDPATRRAGVFVETGMEAFVCRQCGRCCRALDYHNEITAQDMRVWRHKGRQDILKWVSVTRHRNGRETYQIWVDPKTNRFATPCPFLHKPPTQNRWICRIHDVKPSICRNYPVSRKHAVMTGCSGFEASAEGGAGLARTRDHLRAKPITPQA